jgi:hypothetical protein
MKKHQKTKSRPEMPKPLHEPEPDAAEIDVGASEIWVAVAPDRCEKPVRKFHAFTQDLNAIVEWLKECGIRTVAHGVDRCLLDSPLSTSSGCRAESMFSQRSARQECTGSQK